jgi:hypothetical protein
MSHIGKAIAQGFIQRVVEAGANDLRFAVTCSPANSSSLRILGFILPFITVWIEDRR